MRYSLASFICNVKSATVRENRTHCVGERVVACDTTLIEIVFISGWQLTKQHNITVIMDWF